MADEILSPLPVAGVEVAPSSSPPDVGRGQGLALAGVAAGGALIERNQDAELQAIADRIATGHYEIVEAAQKFALDDKELEKLTSRERRIALWARANRNEVPYAIAMAADFAIAREKRKMQEKAPTVNIHAADGAQVGVVLPPRPDAPKESQVVVIDANRLKPPEDREE